MRWPFVVGGVILSMFVLFWFASSNFMECPPYARCMLPQGSMPEPAAVSAADSLTLSTISLIVQSGEQQELRVRVYNPSDRILKNATPHVSCMGFDVVQTVQPTSIAPNAEKEYTLVLGVPLGVEDRPYLCGVELIADGIVVPELGREDLVLRVVS